MPGRSCLCPGLQLDSHTALMEVSGQMYVCTRVFVFVRVCVCVSACVLLVRKKVCMCV
jgi:hypothetical protein